MDAVKAALDGWPQPRFEAGTVVVPTHCLYPSNGVVNVYVDGRETDFLVHDRGAAIEQLHAAIGMEAIPNSFIYGPARRRGVQVAKDGTLFTKGVPIQALAGTIAAVANASREVAAHLLDYYRVPPRRPLSDEVEVILDTRFPKRWRREEVVAGQSTKTHRFDYAVPLGERRLLIDLVKPDASSVNAAVVSHLDVAQADPITFVHRVIYDDRERWPSASLALLRVGAVPVALSAANDVLGHLAVA